MTSDPSPAPSAKEALDTLKATLSKRVLFLDKLHREAVARNFKLVADNAALTDRLRRALSDVEPVFAYLEADIELSMTDDSEAEIDVCEAHETEDLCGHSICANTGCVSLHLRNIRAALHPGAPDER